MESSFKTEVELLLKKISSFFGVRFMEHPEPPENPVYYASLQDGELQCYLPKQYFESPSMTYFYLKEFEETISLHKHLAETQNIPMPTSIDANREIRLETSSPKPGSVLEWIMTRVKRHKLEVLLAPNDYFKGDLQDAGGFAQGTRIYLKRIYGKELERGATKGLIAHELLHGANAFDCEHNYSKCGKVIEFSSSDVNLFTGELQSDEVLSLVAGGVDLSVYSKLYEKFFRSDEVEAYRLSAHYAETPKKRREFRNVIMKFAVNQSLILNEVLKGIAAGKFSFVEKKDSTVIVNYNGGSVRVKMTYEDFDDEEAARNFYRDMILERLRQIRNHMKAVHRKG